MEISGRMLKKSVISIALFLGAACMLSGCGKSKLPEGYWTLASIEEDGKLKEDDDLKDYGLDDAYVSVDKEGSGYAVLFGIPVDFSVDRDKGCFKFDSTGKVNYKVSGKKLTLADKNITMVFAKSKEDEPEKPEPKELVSYTIKGSDSGSTDISSDSGSSDDSTSEDGSSSSGGSKLGNDLAGLLGDSDSGSSGNNLDADNPYDFFNGDWYGFWTLDAHADIYKPYDGQKNDCLCKIEMNDDGQTGTMRIWDYGEYTYDNPYAKVEISVRDGLDKKIKAITSESGYWFDYNIEHADWIIDPGLYDFSNYILVDARAENEDGDIQYYYYIHLKKWGADWDDFGETPIQYDWYKDLIDKGESMPDEIPEW